LIDTVANRTFREILDGLRREIGAERHDMWFRDVSLLGFKRGRVRMGVPNEFFREWIALHYVESLARKSKDILGTPVTFDIVIDAELAEAHRKRVEASRLREALAESESTPSRPSFANFIVRPENEFAYQTMKRLVTDRCHAGGERVLSESFNPLVLVGPSGAGKSHLLKGAAEELAATGRVVSLTAEELTRQFTASLRAKRGLGFRARLESSDVLVVDEVHRLKGKSATQRELLTLIRILQDRGSQVLLAARHHPREIHDMSATLQSILLSGMLVKMDLPSVSSVLEFFRSRHPKTRKVASSRLVRRLARGCRGHVEELERRLQRVRALSALLGAEPTVEFAEQHARDIEGDEGQGADVEDGVVDAIVSRFGVTKTDVLSKRKLRSLGLPRGMIAWILRERRGLTYKEIGRVLGGRSHTSVHVMLKKHRDLIEGDPELRKIAETVPCPPRRS